MSKFSLNKTISKFNLNIELDFLLELNYPHNEIQNFISKSHNYFTKYSKGSSISKQYILENIPKYINRVKTTKVTLETFKLFGLGETEYKSFCYNKGKSFRDSNIQKDNVSKKLKKYSKEELRKQSNCSLEYYVTKGYSEQEAKEKLKERQTTFSKKICIEKYGKEKGLEVFNERQDKWQKTLSNKPQEEIDRINKSKNYLPKLSKKEYDDYITKLKIRLNSATNREKVYNTKLSKGLVIPDSSRTDFELYSFKVRKITKHQNLQSLKNFDKRGQLDEQFHLDHKYSIFQGFKDNIPTYIIGNIKNLEMIHSRLNNTKGIECSLAKEELFSNFFQ